MHGTYCKIMGEGPKYVYSKGLNKNKMENKMENVFFIESYHLRIYEEKKNIQNHDEEKNHAYCLLYSLHRVFKSKQTDINNLSNTWLCFSAFSFLLITQSHSKHAPPPPLKEL